MRVASELAQASALYNEGKYQASIDSFECVSQGCKSDADKQALAVFLPLKLRCYLQLKQLSVLTTELTSTLNTYAQDIPTQMSIVGALYHFEMETVLLGVNIPSRFIYGQQSAISSKHQLHDIEHIAIEHFNRLAPDPHEHNVYFTGLDEVRHCFDPSQIQHYQVESLPNGNLYIAFQLTSEAVSLQGSLPGPSNDAICETGTIILIHQGTEKHAEVSRHDVTLAKNWGPFHLQAKTPFGVISIINTHLAGQTPTNL